MRFFPRREWRKKQMKMKELAKDPQEALAGVNAAPTFPKTIILFWEMLELG